MKNCKVFLILILTSFHSLFSQQESEIHIPELKNPKSADYLQKKLTTTGPRLVINSKIEKKLKKKLESDTLVRNLYEAIKINADSILREPLLKRKMQGRRLLAVSREMLYRMNMLGMVYRMEKNPRILKRIDEEITAVCNFTDWNPAHFLDVAEMALAVSLGVDWTRGSLPKETIARAKSALIEKGIKPSFGNENVPWIYNDNNWNQVCHGGMIAAAITTADEDPALAALTIRRALKGIPYGLAPYSPDGVYPEGATYWGYGTSFTVLTIAMFESAFGTDFGISKFQPFMQSADFKVLSSAPSGRYYNFADSGGERGNSGDFTLAWFGSKTGNKTYFEKERFLAPPKDMGRLPRHAGAALVWISQFQEKGEIEMPTAWKGGGENPIVIFKSSASDTSHYYVGCKGGKATVNHGNMDAGSFIFELNGVRWVTDPGNQKYHDLERAGFDLWKSCQHCQRWTLLTKNNYGHSTLTVDEQLHRVDGKAFFIDFKSGDTPEATLNMGATFEGQLKSVYRKFLKDSPTSLIVEDKIIATDSTHLVTWQLITTADIEITEDGALLRQDGQQLNLQNLSHPAISVSVVSLDPPPYKLDKRIKNLKRIELRIPAYTFKNNETTIKIRLSGG